VCILFRILFMLYRRRRDHRLPGPSYCLWHSTLFRWCIYWTIDCRVQGFRL